MRLTDNIRALVDAAMRDRGFSMNAVAKEIGINQPTLLPAAWSARLMTSCGEPLRL